MSDTNNIPRYHSTDEFSGLRRNKLKGLLAIGVLMMIGSQARAASFEFDSITLDVDSVVTYGVQWRVEDRDPVLSESTTDGLAELVNLPNMIDYAFTINGNDGNNNFDQGDMVANRVSFLTDMDINFGGDTGIFMRGKMYYDVVYGGDSEMDRQDYYSYNGNPRYGDNGGHTTEQGEYNAEAVDYMKANARLLDLFLYTSFDIGDRLMGLRLGRQTISWGESLLSGGGFNMAQNHVDAQIRNTPGLEVKELFLPTGAIFGQIDLTPNLAMLAYYQYEWQATVMDPATTYFSEMDALGEGGETFMFLTGEERYLFGYDMQDPDNADLKPYLPRDNCPATAECNYLALHKYEDKDAKDSGQFGIGFQYVLGNGDELGFYYANYHEKNPNFILPIDIIDDMAPMVNLLLDPDMGTAGDDVFTGPEDLGSNLSVAQLKSLLDFMGAVPHEGGGGTIREIMNNMGVTIKDGLPIDFSDPAIQEMASGVLTKSGLSLGSWVNSMDYRIVYFEDIDIWAVSYSTVIGDANFAGEISYRENAPVMRGNVGRTPDCEKIYHMHLNTLMLFEPTAFWDFSSFTAEIVAWHIPGRKNFNIYDMSNTDRLAVQNTANGSGLGLLWSLEYKSVFPGVDLTVPIYVSHGIDGAMFATGYRNHQTTVAVGLTGTYFQSLEVGFAYASYFGEKDDQFQRMTSDRDNMSLNLKYGF